MLKTEVNNLMQGTLATENIWKYFSTSIEFFPKESLNPFKAWW